MKVACDGRSEKDDALHVRSTCFAHALYKFVNRVDRNHLFLAILPTAARTAAAGASTAESSEATTSAKTASPAEASPTPKTASPPESSPASAKNLRKEQPEQEFAQGREEDDQSNDNDYKDSAEGYSGVFGRLASSRRAWLRRRELNAGIGCDDVGDAACNQ